MSDMDKILSSVLKSDIISTEDIIVDAVRDLVRDEIKMYIRDKLYKNPKLKEEIKKAVGELIEAKIKEAYALAKIGKCGAKLGLDLVPEHLRKEMMKELLGLFEEEIGAIMEKTV